MGLILNSGFTIGPGVVLNGGYNTVLTSGLRLYLDAGNVNSYPGSGNTWTDLIGSKIFYFYGAPTYNSANGGYINFNPSNSDYAQCSTSLSTLSTWSVEVWHYYDYGTTGSAPAILTEIYTNNSLNYALGNDNGSGLSIGYYDGADGSNTGWHYTPGYAFGFGNWYHIVGTYDGSALKLYINGHLVESTAASSAIRSSNSGIRLMSRWDNPDFWGGRLSVVRIYNNDITQMGVTNNFNAERTRFGI